MDAASSPILLLRQARMNKKAESPQTLNPKPSTLNPKPQTPPNRGLDLIWALSPALNTHSKH